MRNIKLKHKDHVSSFRKLAIGAWKTPDSPTIFGKKILDITEMETYLKHHPSKEPVSLTHVFIKAISVLIDRYPVLNRVLIRNTLYVRETNSVFLQTHLRTTKGYDLLGVNIQDPYKKSLSEIAALTKEKTLELRRNENKPMERARWITSLFPSSWMPYVVKCFDWVMYTLNLNCSWLGLPSDQYGSAMITAVSAMGIEECFVPLFPFSRCGFIMALGKPYTTLVKEDGEIKEKRHVVVTFTMDHRYFDGAHFAKPLRLLKRLIENPEQLDPIKIPEKVLA